MLELIVGIVITILIAPILVRWSPIISVLMFLCIIFGGKWAIIPFLISTGIWIFAIILKKKL